MYSFWVCPQIVQYKVRDVLYSAVLWFILFTRVFLFLAVNPCSEEPCQNGGTCGVLAGEFYHCECPGGYYGKNCQKGT